MKIVISPAKSLDFERTLPTETYSEASFLKEAKKINGLLKKTITLLFVLTRTNHFMLILF